MNECIEWMSGRMNALNEWMNEWMYCMNAWKNEWLSEQVSAVIAWMNECMSEWVNACIAFMMNVWMHEWMTEWMNAWPSQCIEWMNDSTNEGINEWMNECIDEWMHERANITSFLNFQKSCPRKRYGNFHWNSTELNSPVHYRLMQFQLPCLFLHYFAWSVHICCFATFVSVMDFTKKVDFQNTCSRKRFNYVFWNSAELNSWVTLPIDAVSVPALISTLLCMTCEHRFFATFVGVMRYHEFGRFSNACPRKWLHHFCWNSTQLNSWVLLRIDGVSVPVLISTLFCMTCEHQLFSDFLCYAISRKKSIFKMHVLESCLTIFSETPLSWTTEAYYWLIEFQFLYSFRHYFAWPANIDYFAIFLCTWHIMNLVDFQNACPRKWFGHFLKLHSIALLSFTASWRSFTARTHFYATLHDLWTSSFFDVATMHHCSQVDYSKLDHKVRKNQVRKTFFFASKA